MRHCTNIDAHMLSLHLLPCGLGRVGAGLNGEKFRNLKFCDFSTYLILSSQFVLPVSEMASITLNTVLVLGEMFA